MLPKNDPSPDRVRALLEKAGLSQRKAAKILGINPRTMRHYCAGSLPTPYSIQLSLVLIGILRKKATSDFL